MTRTVTEVPLLDLTRIDAELRDELEDAFARVLGSGRFILGPEVSAFESECAAYCGVEHAVGVSSGTDALLVALMALDVGPGDEVICPAYTFFATAGSVWRLGATPVFADCLPGSFNIDPGDIEHRITKNTRAIIPVHLFGQCAEMDPILEIARRRGLHVIEDAAQAIGAEYRGRRAGSMGDLGCFSFFPTKNLPACGDGGLVTANDGELAERVRVLRVHGSRPKYHHGLVGGNFRLDEVQAALLRVRLRRLDAATAARQRNAELYTRLFCEAQLAAAPASAGASAPAAAEAPPGARLALPARCEGRHIYNQFVVRVHGEGQRDLLREHLAARKVGTEIYYPIPLHLQKCFEPLYGAEGDLPESERAAKETLALPIFPDLSEEEIAYVVGQVAEFFA
jgi:dTDP-4-amino-4,6-dideoxygalactose transaminase